MLSSTDDRPRGYRAIPAAFIIGLLLGTMAHDVIRPASAQIANPYQQRADTNQGLDQMNARLGELLTLLRTGTLKVRVVETDKTSSAARPSSERSEPAPLPPVSPARAPVVVPGSGNPAR